MNIIKTQYLIPINLFDTCLIDNMSRSEIIKLHPSRKNGAYYLNKFDNHLKNNYNINIKEYCKNNLNINWPTCPISHEEVGYLINGKGINLSKFKRGCISKEHCPAFKVSSEKLSLERMGKNNPMYGKKAWNTGKDKRNPIIKLVAQKRLGRIVSESTKEKQSVSAKKRLIHGHTGFKHSKSNKIKFRENTAKLWASGRFNRTSSIHVKTRDFLKTLNLKEPFVEEFQVKYFSMDFAFPKSKIAIECQGTYFHIDQRVYPNGPIDAIQRRNFGRDKAKRKVCEGREGWKIIEIWETEINDGQFKNILLCKLSELNLIKQLE